MKAVITSFVLVLATGSLVLAQTEAPAPPPSGSAPIVATPAPAPTMAPAAPLSPVNEATEEAVHRQADRIEARNKLDQARAAELRKDFPTAAKLYDDAWALASDVGPSAAP